MELGESLKRTAVTGIEWNSLSAIVTSAFMSLQVAALSYFLSPSAFGIMAMAMVAIGFAQAFNDVGLSNAIIQRQEIKADALSSLYWLQIALGVLLFIIVLAITPLTAQFFGEPALNRVMALTGFIFLVAPVGQMYQILMQKGMEFKRLAVIDITTSFLSMVIAVAAAYAGLGVLALVLGQLAYYGIRSVQFWLAGHQRWRVTFHFRYSDLKGFLSFGLYQMGDRTVTYFAINVLNLIIGKFLGPHVLGLYSMAYQLILTPILRVSTVMTTVSFPIFSKLQNMNILLKEGYLLLSRFISLTICPALILVIVTAPVFIPAFLGPKWIEAIPMVQVLSIVAIIQSLVSTAVPTYLAKGKADFGFRWNFLVALMNTIAFYFIAPYGIMALAWAFVCLSLTQYIILQMIMDTLIELKWGQYAGALAVQLLIGTAMGIIVYLSYLAIRSSGIRPVELLIVLVIIGFISYALMNLEFNRVFLRELKDLIISTKPALPLH